MLENVPDVLTVKDVMKVLRCGRNKVMDYIHEGVLEGHFVSGKWLVFRQDVEEFILRSQIQKETWKNQFQRFENNPGTGSFFMPFIVNLRISGIYYFSENQYGINLRTVCSGN